MSERGVFAVDRGVFDHPFFEPEPYTEREAWLWMVGAAAWRAKRVRVGREVTNLERGQLAFSLRFVATKWRWSEARVRRFISRLKTDAMIDAQATRQATHITICNYDKYAFDRLSNDAETDAQSDARATHERRKEEEDKKVRKGSKEDSEANASAAPMAAAPPVTPDFRSELFQRGLAELAVMTGKAAPQARTFIGKLLRDANDDAVVVLEAIDRAIEARPADPSSFIAKIVRAHSRDGPAAYGTGERRTAILSSNGVRNDGSQRRSALEGVDALRDAIDRGFDFPPRPA